MADRLNAAYHTERQIAAREGIGRYLCACRKCHGFKTQSVITVERHHRQFRRDRSLLEPVLATLIRPDGFQNEDRDNEGESVSANEDEYEDLEETIQNTFVNYKAVAQNYFSRADDIHTDSASMDDAVLNFDDVSDAEDVADKTKVLESILRQSSEKLFPDVEKHFIGRVTQIFENVRSARNPGTSTAPRLSLLGCFVISQ